MLHPDVLGRGPVQVAFGDRDVMAEVDSGNLPGQDCLHRHNRTVLGFATKGEKTLSPPRPETQRTRSSRKSPFANGKRNLQLS
jgi:hypothetical protein